MDFRARIIADLDISKAQAQLKSLTKDQKVDLAVNVAIKNAQELKNLQADALSLQNKLGKIGIRIDSKQAIQAIKQVEKESAQIQKQMIKQQQSVNAAFYKQFFENDFKTNHTKSPELEAMAKDYAEMQKEAIKTQQKINKINKESSSGLFQYRNSKNQSFLDKYVGQESEALSRARTQIEEIKRLQSDISSGNLDQNSLISAYEKLNSEVEKLSYSMKQVANEQSKTLDVGVADTSANKVKAYAETNSKALSKYRTELEALEKAYRNITTQAEKIDLDNQFRNLQSKISSEGLTGKSRLSEFKRAMGQIAEFAGVYGLIQNVAFEIPRQLIQAVQDIDAAQIELLKVSGASETQLSAYWDQAAESAKKYGATVSDVIQSTADWSRLGYDLDDAKILSDLTTLYEKVGDNMTQESASESLISTLQGYQLTANQAEHIVDAFNEVGNNFAIGSDGIGEALQRSASSMYAAGNTMEETIGLVTAANTVVQDPASVGTAFKTISMRIRGKLCAQQAEMLVPHPLKIKVA